MPATFTTPPLRRERAAQHRDAALRVDRIGERVNDLAVGLRWIEIGEVLGHGLAGDGEAIAVEQTVLEQLAENQLHAADTVEVGHVVLAVRLHVGDVRNARADAIEVVELELDTRLVRDREQVQHRVRGAAERHRDRDRVLERLFRHDLPRPDAQRDEVHDRFA